VNVKYSLLSKDGLLDASGTKRKEATEDRAMCYVIEPTYGSNTAHSLTELSQRELLTT